MLNMSTTADNIMQQISALGVSSAAESLISVEDMLANMIQQTTGDDWT